MKILTADDEPFALQSIEAAVREALPDAELRGFSQAAAALSEISGNGYYPDVALLDIRMPGINGLEMAKRIKEMSPHTNIIFVTAYNDYALDAFALHPSGYLMKPVTAEKVKLEIENLRYPVRHKPTSRIRVQCFGNFEVFADGKVVNYTYQKTKELLAYLIDRRGAACNTAELCAVLWEEKPDSPELRKYLRKLLADLSHSLAAVDAEDIFAKTRNQFAIVPDKLDCDYYEMLANDINAINTYSGEYMAQYSWAEMTLGSIEKSR